MLILLSSGSIVAILYFGRDIIVPITLALLLSFLLSPAVRALRRLRMGRVTAVAVTVLIAFVVISGFVVREISSLARIFLNTGTTSKPRFAPSPSSSLVGRSCTERQQY
jgi:predicted PurR-regulated permease PerM